MWIEGENGFLAESRSFYGPCKTLRIASTLLATFRISYIPLEATLKSIDTKKEEIPAFKRLNRKLKMEARC